jgi:hypothetical protein
MEGTITKCTLRIISNMVTINIRIGNLSYVPGLNYEQVVYSLSNKYGCQSSDHFSDIFVSVFQIY